MNANEIIKDLLKKDLLFDAISYKLNNNELKINIRDLESNLSLNVQYNYEGNKNDFEKLFHQERNKHRMSKSINVLLKKNIKELKSENLMFMAGYENYGLYLRMEEAIEVTNILCSHGYEKKFRIKCPNCGKSNLYNSNIFKCLSCSKDVDLIKEDEEYSIKHPLAIGFPSDYLIEVVIVKK